VTAVDTVKVADREGAGCARPVVGKSAKYLHQWFQLRSRRVRCEIPDYTVTRMLHSNVGCSAAERQGEGWLSKKKRRLRTGGVRSGGQGRLIRRSDG
jgi:hypothetical protein